MAGRVPSLVVAVVCALLAMFLALNGRDASLVRDANREGRAGRLDAALQTAGKVHRAPADLRALLATARAHTAAGRLPQADAAWAAVARRDPNNWRVHFEWARALGALDGDEAKAVRVYDRARELNPRLPAL
jgi:tetratricopeptide (TPR) repeat protein